MQYCMDDCELSVGEAILGVWRLETPNAQLIESLRSCDVPKLMAIILRGLSPEYGET
jgi:hypothetical protein